MFGDILKQLRKRNHMTQGDLANALKISRSTVAMYETDVRNPDHELMMRISELFNVSMDYLYEREPVADSSLSENKRKLIEWAKTVPEDKVEPILQALQSILAALQ